DRDFLAVGWEDARDANQVVTGDSGVAQGQLEARQLFAMGPHTLGKEQFLGYIHLVPDTSRTGRPCRSCRVWLPHRTVVASPPRAARFQRELLWDSDLTSSPYGAGVVRKGTAPCDYRSSWSPGGQLSPGPSAQPPRPGR